MTPSSRTLASRRLGLYDLICAALAPVAAYALRDVQYFGPEFIKLTLVYTVISCLTTVAMLTSFRVGSALSRYFMNVDVFPILRACFLSAALPALAIFVLPDLRTCLAPCQSSISSF